MREIITGAIDGNRIPAASIVVTRDDEIVWAEGFGFADIAKQSKATPDTIFLLASVSKPITAIGLMALADSGKIDITQPVNDYLPNTKMQSWVTNPDDISVSHLLHHTSGLGTHYNFFFQDAPPTMDESIHRFARTVRPPGERYNCSNLGYGILEYLTQVISATPWDDYMQQHVYDPLGMTRTADHVRPEHLDDRAEIYIKGANDTFQIQKPYDFDHRGASTVWSSAHDLTRLLQMINNRGQHDGKRFLKPETAEAMITPGPVDAYGLGWATRANKTRRYYDHSGGMPGVSTLISAWPDDKITLVILSNTSAASINYPVRDKLEDILLPENRWGRPPRRAQSEKADDFDPKGIWTGSLHHFDGSIPVTLEVDESNAITLTYDNGEPEKLERTSTAGWIRARTSQVIHIQDEYKGPSNIAFNLTPAENNHDTINGPVVVEAPGRFMMTLYATLKRSN